MKAQDSKPIPLTEEKCIELFNKTALDICSEINNNEIMYCDFITNDLLKLYAHQLQNLYSALTGKELEIIS